MFGVQTNILSIVCDVKAIGLFYHSFGQEVFCVRCMYCYIPSGEQLLRGIDVCCLSGPFLRGKIRLTFCFPLQQGVLPIKQYSTYATVFSIGTGMQRSFK